MSLYNELKRRNVIRVGIAYIVAAWLIIQVAETIFPLFGYGDTPARIVVIALAIGFPLFLVFSWVFEFTAQGLKRETDIDLSVAVTHKSGKQLDRIIIVLLALGLGYFAFDKFVFDPARDAELVEATAREARSVALTESYGDKSIAVLPFINMSADASNEYFSDGISEEILNLLAKIPELRVISRSSAFSFKDSDLQIPEIAKSLNTAHILEGSVRKSGDRVRITAQLIEARSDTQLWSEVYSRDVRDVFAVQDEIAGEICKQLELTIVNSGSPDRPTENEEAYDLYLRGLHFLRKTPFQENAPKARDRFQAAIDLDPDYAQAYAQLSLAMITMANFFVLSPSEALPRAKEAANAALALDDALFEAHVALGWVALSYEHNWSQAETEFRRAIVLAPGDYQGYQGLAWALQVTGRYAEAIEALLKARDADPMALWVRSAQADFYWKLRDYDQALASALSMLEMTPDDVTLLAGVGQIYAEKQEPIQSLSYAKKAAGLTGGNPNTELSIALIYATLGDQSEARNILRLIDLDNQTRYIAPGSLAAVYANLGENDLAMDALARAVEEYDSWVWNLDYPMWDPIRTDTRFIKLCEDLQMACAEIPTLEGSR